MIPIRIEPFFLVLAALIGWLNSGNVQLTALWMGVIFISVLVHEFGHALTACLFGQKAMITLTAFGGLTSRRGPPISGWKEFFIVLNGPLAGILLYFVCAYLLTIPQFKEGYIAYMLTVGTWINLFWTLLNLVPVQPLDGGQLVLIMMRGLFGHRGIRFALIFSLLVSVALGVFFFLNGLMLAGAIFLLFAFESYRGYSSARALTANDEKEPLKRLMEKAMSLYRKGNVERADTLFQQVRKEASDGVIHLSATVRLAERALSVDQPDEALHLLLPYRKELEGEELKLLMNAAFQSGDWKLSLELGSEIFREEADPAVAVWNAMSAAELLLEEQALGWLQTAHREGVDIAPLLSDIHFDPIRDSSGFKAFSA